MLHVLDLVCQVLDLVLQRVHLLLLLAQLLSHLLVLVLAHTLAGCLHEVEQLGLGGF
jgi:hypothetical protein